MSGINAEACQGQQARAIPTRRIQISDPSQLPSEYSSTPGGTLFSTTPGGTRIIYDRAFLLQCRNSPLTKSPPPNMAKIPGVTTTGAGDAKENGHEPTKTEKDANKLPENAEEPQFEMDI